MFNQLSAVDGGHKKSRWFRFRARRSMHWAIEFTLQHRPVNFPELPFAGLIIDSHDDSVRMEKIVDARAFPQKFRVRRHAKGYFGLASVNSQSLLELLASLNGHRAFLNHQFGCL